MSLKASFLGLTLAVTTALAGPGPALAAAEPATVTEPFQAPVSPELAAGLSLVPPMATMIMMGVNPSLPAALGYLLVGSAPASFGLGQLYAGDPGRAALVGLGGYAASGVALGTMAVVSAQAPLSSPVTYLGVLVPVAIMAGYGGWAAQDAYHTALRTNAEAFRAYQDRLEPQTGLPPLPAAWAYGATVGDLPREPVVTRLLADGLYRGMAYDRVVRWLGRPGEVRRLSRGDASVDATYRWTNPDSGYLEIEFEAGHVSGWQTHNLP